MKKFGILLITLFSFCVLTLPAQAAPLIGTWEGPEDFTPPGNWKETSPSCQEGATGNIIKASSLPHYLFDGAALTSVHQLTPAGPEPCENYISGNTFAGSAYVFETNYAGGNLTLGNTNQSPWSNPNDTRTRFRATLTSTKVLTCKYVNSSGSPTGEMAFELKSNASFIDYPDFYASVLAHYYRNEPSSTGTGTPGDPCAKSGPLDFAKITITGVSIDIKPGSCPNPINVRSQGVLPVAILGSANLDVRDIDPRSIKLMVGTNGGVAPIRWNYEDVATPYVPSTFPRNRFSCNNIGSDGYDDLNLKFKTQDIISKLILHGFKREDVLLELTFELRDGTELHGEDVVVILNNKK